MNSVRRHGASYWVLALALATTGLALTAHTALADYNDGVQRSEFSSSYDVGVFQDCQGPEECEYYSVQYDWGGTWGYEVWSIDSPPYHYDLDYEANTTESAVFSSGVAINGRNENISIAPNQWVDECWSSRPNCGAEYEDYNSGRDSRRRAAAVTCGGADWCNAMEVPNLDMTGYFDPAIWTGACEWPTGSSNAVPWSGTCDSGGIYYDMGQ
jgi:hypothetical protein